MKGSSSQSSSSSSLAVPRRCLVTGGSGFVGQRLVEMLIERGAELVISFDISPKPKDALTTTKVDYIQGDLTRYQDLLEACKNSLQGQGKQGQGQGQQEHQLDCIFHIAALVGPYHPQEAYYKVNYEGTKNILQLTKDLKITKIVMSSSPSTRFPYPDPNVNYLTEEELYQVNGGDFTKVFLQPYAETKALGEKLIRDACGKKEGDLLTIAVAPHQVYGPRDGLFLPNLLETAGNGSLRVFGDGKNQISFCHVDNYCHGLMLGAQALYPGSPALGKFYIITDGPPINFWKALDQAVIAMNFVSLFSKFHLPTWFMMTIAYLTLFLGNLYAMITGTPKHVVNYHLKLNPFAVKMLVINRSFNIEAAKRDLKYEPIYDFQRGWAMTIEWFQQNWLPKYLASRKK